MLTNIFTLEKQVLITFIASFLIWTMAGGLVYLWVFKKKIKFQYMIYIFVVWLVSWVISEFLKEVTAIDRPFIANGVMPLTITIPSDYSFPSAHASSAFAMAASLRKYNTRLFFVYMIFAFLVALGRVLSRVHYFIDVFAGALIGVAVVYILEKMGMERFFKKVLT